MANKHVKRCSAHTLLIISEMQIKATIKCHYTSIRVAKIIIKRQAIPSADEDVELLELSYVTDENVKWCSHFRNLLDIFFKS